MTPLEELAASLTAAFEGLRLKAYQDSGGVWTIGIGHTGKDVTPGLTITPEKAYELFAADQAPLVATLAGRPILEAAALADFGFNCGRGALSKVLDGTDSIDNPKHTTDRKGNVLGGLVARRKLESLLIRISRGEIT